MVSVEETSPAPLPYTVSRGVADPGRIDYIDCMEVSVLVATATGMTRMPSIRSVTVWFKEKGLSALSKLTLCFLVCLLMGLGGLQPINMDVSRINEVSLVIPATYEPIAVPVRITAYNPVEEQTDETPLTMASGKTVYRGAVALSRDLEADLGLRFGDSIEIDGLGLFVFEDRMHRRWKRTVDILLFSPEKARRFGVQHGFLRIH